MRDRAYQQFTHPRPKFSVAYSFAIVTAVLFVVSWVGQLVFQLIEVRNEASQHGQSFSWGDFWPQFLSSTFENWQSEFLQLVWQAVGLTLFYFWGSSQSRESDDRMEAKIDALLKERGMDPLDFELAEDEQAKRQTGHVAE